MHYRAILIASALAVSACGGSTSASPTSAAPTSAAPTPSSAPTTGADATTRPTVYTPTPPTTTTTPTPTAVVRLPTNPSCLNGLGPAPTAQTPQITFISGGYLWSTTPDNASEVQCLQAVPPTTALSWGPTGDRLLLDDRAQIGNGTLHSVGAGSWSTPTGTQVLAVEDGALVKHNAVSGAAKAITFLPSIESAVYHPAGRAVTAVGTSLDGTYGIWLATNTGATPKLITKAVTAPHIGELNWSGNQLYFIADHGDNWDVNVLQIPGLELSDGYNSKLPLSHLVVSPNGTYAVQEGDCHDGGQRQRAVVPVADGPGLPGPLGSLITRPVAAIDNSTLLVAASSTCGGPEDLWELRFDYSRASWATPLLLVHDVGAVAVRALAPTPSELPTNIEARAPG